MPISRSKSYKARLNRWGFSKYITDKHEREALRRLVADGLQPQETFQLGNGAVVSLSSLASHLERKRSSASFYPATSVLRPPEDLWLSERMLSSAREYIRRCTGERGADQDLRASLPSPLGDFFKGFVALRRLLRESRFEDALPLLQQAPMQIRTLLQGSNALDNPAACIYITVLCTKWHDSMAGHMNDILRALMRYAASVVLESSGPEPLRQILAGLVQIDDAVFREAVVQTWKCQLQTWTSIVAPEWDIQLLGEWMALAETAGVKHLPGNILEGLKDTIYKHEIKYGRCSLPVLTLLWLQAEYKRLYAETYNTSTESAKRVFIDLLERGKDFDKLGKYSAQYFLAKEFKKSMDRGNAEKYLNEAIESLCELEERPCYGISALQEMIFDLECWYTEWGEDEKANDIRQRRLNICLAYERKRRSSSVSDA